MQPRGPEPSPQSAGDEQVSVARGRYCRQSRSEPPPSKCRCFPETKSTIPPPSQARRPAATAPADLFLKLSRRCPSLPAAPHRLDPKLLHLTGVRDTQRKLRILK